MSVEPTMPVELVEVYELFRIIRQRRSPATRKELCRLFAYYVWPVPEDVLSFMSTQTIRKTVTVFLYIRLESTWKHKRRLKNEIAKVAGVSQTTVYYWLREVGK